MLETIMKNNSAIIEGSQVAELKKGAKDSNIKLMKLSCVHFYEFKDDIIEFFSNKEDEIILIIGSVLNKG